MKKTNLFSLVLAICVCGSLAAMEEMKFINKIEWNRSSGGSARCTVFETKAPIFRDVMLYVLCHKIEKSKNTEEVSFCKASIDGMIEFTSPNDKRSERYASWQEWSHLPEANKFFLAMTKKLFVRNSGDSFRKYYPKLSSMLSVKEKTIRICYIEIPVLRKEGLGVEGLHPDISASLIKTLVSDVEEKYGFKQSVFKCMSTHTAILAEEHLLEPNVRRVNSEWDKKTPDNIAFFESNSLENTLKCCKEIEKKEVKYSPEQKSETEFDRSNGIRFVFSGGDCTDIASLLAEEVPFYAFNIGPIERSNLKTRFFGGNKFSSQHYGRVANLRTGKNDKNEVNGEKKSDLSFELTANDPFSLETIGKAITILADKWFF